MYLPGLLRNVLRQLEQAYAAEGAAEPQMPSLDLWANLLRALEDGESEIATLPAVLCLSSRAVSTRLKVALRRGWVEEFTLASGNRAVQPTDRGRRVTQRWKSLQKTAEEKLQVKAGLSRVSSLRAALIEILLKSPLEYPHYPAGYGPADARITGGNGQDWKSVFRDIGDSVSCLSLSALLAQAWVAFAMDYEELSPVALSLSDAVIQAVPQKRMLFREISDPAGVSALARHGFLRLSGEGTARIAFLTARGGAVKDAHKERINAVDAKWRTRFGEDAVQTLCLALELVND